MLGSNAVKRSTGERRLFGLGDISTDVVDVTDPTGGISTFDPSTVYSTIPNVVDPNALTNQEWQAAVSSEMQPTLAQPSSIVNSILSDISTGINKIAVPILNSQFGGPQPGQYFQTGPNGQSIAYSLPQGSTAGFTLSSFPSSLSGMLPILIIGGVVLLFMSGMGRK